MYNLPASLPSCGHGAESTTYLLLSCKVGPRHHAQCAQALCELDKLFKATGTSIRLELHISGHVKLDPKRGRLDILPPEYSLSLGCNGPFQSLASQSGQLLSAPQLLAFISDTLKGGKQ